MLKFNLFQKFMLVYCVSIAIASCSADESLTTDVSPQNQVLSRTNEDDLLKEANSILENQLKLKGINVKSSITKIDNAKPTNYEYYVTKMNKKVQIVEETIRISFLADNELEEFDIFVIRYKEYDAVRSMVIIENKYFDNILIYDAAFVDYPTAKPDIQIHEIESPIYVANKVRFSSSCYKRCASELMNNLPLWHVGIIGTFCTPCGVAAGVYAAAGILGCTGGCFVTVWEK